MRRQDRAAARRQLDKRIRVFAKAETLSSPPNGWIKAVRESIGMTTTQLAVRLGMSQTRVSAIEKAEIDHSTKLSTLERAAHALGCRLVYAFVPKTTLEDIVTEQAKRVAMQSFAATRHSMALEDQEVDASEQQAQLTRVTRQLIDNAGPELWKEKDD